MLLQEFQEHIQSKQLFHPHDLLIVAVSGGADSVALCALCHRSGYTFQMAHCNFQLRGEESDRDERFVTDVAQKYGVPLHVRRFDTHQYARENRINTQLAARALRYAWFDELVQTAKQPEGRVLLLTAHHANDNVETLMMNFFKGTGIAGLKGIRERSGYIVRPLLFATRDQVISFLRQHGIPYMEDSSNLSDDYTRNYLRNRVIPSLTEVFPAVEQNLMKSLARFQDIALLYDESVQHHLQKILEHKGQEVHIPILKLVKHPAWKTILYEVIRKYGFVAGQVEDVCRLTQSQSGSFVASPSWRIMRNRAWLIITPVKAEDSAHIIIGPEEQRIRFALGALSMQHLDWDAGSDITADPLIALIDFDTISFPMILRKWKEGDYFYPLGMRKKKKLSRFFIDHKIAVADKEKIWVLEHDRRIIWIAGMRIDDRFKVTNQTKKVLRISLHPISKSGTID